MRTHLRLPAASRNLTGLGLAVVSIAATGCGSSVALAGATPSGPPSGVTARLLNSPGHGLPAPGARVGASSLGTRVFADTNHGFALAGVHGVTYPASSEDGGRTWQIDGPAFHLPAAQGPVAVNEPGVAGPRMYFAWCSPFCNTVVDVTSDAGKHWWQSFMPGIVLAVTGHAGQITAVVEGPAPSQSGSGSGASFWAYTTTNGRRWKYRESLSAVS